MPSPSPDTFVRWSRHLRYVRHPLENVQFWRLSYWLHFQHIVTYYRFHLSVFKRTDRLSSFNSSTATATTTVRSSAPLSFPNLKFIIYLKRVARKYRKYTTNLTVQLFEIITATWKALQNIGRHLTVPSLHLVPEFSAGRWSRYPSATHSLWTMDMHLDLPGPPFPHLLPLRIKMPNYDNMSKRVQVSSTEFYSTKVSFLASSMEAQKGRIHQERGLNSELKHSAWMMELPKLCEDLVFRKYACLSNLCREGLSKSSAWSYFLPLTLAIILLR